MIKKVYNVIENYETPYPSSIPFRMNEEVNIGKEFDEDPEWINWIWCTGKSNQSAWVPKQFIKDNGNIGVILKDFDAKELSVMIGESLVVSEIINGFGMSCKSNGEKGWVPMKVMEEIK